jgi:arginyl-tRNA--protein-N-Asp/Glu arginylyltransferase
VLAIIAAARERRLPYVYLGYYVEGCASLEYKARFRPNEVLQSDGIWRPFLSHLDPQAASVERAGDQDPDDRVEQRKRE